MKIVCAFCVQSVLRKGFLMLSGDKFFTAMDAFELHQKGIIILRKTKLKDSKNNLYRVMRFENVMGSMKMFIEFPNGDHVAVGTKEIRVLGLALSNHPDHSISEWIDPA